jgi:ribonuclease E
MADESKDTEKSSAPKRRSASRPAGPPVGEKKVAAKKAKESAAKPVVEEKSEPKTSKKPVKKTRGGKKAKSDSKAEVSVEVESTSPAVPLAAVFQPADDDKPAARTRNRNERPNKNSKPNNKKNADSKKNSESSDSAESEGSADSSEESHEGETPQQRRRRRGGRRRRRGSNENGENGESTDSESTEEESDTDGEPTLRRRKRTRTNENDDRKSEETRGSTRLEAKKQRRREGREHGRRRAPILSEAEFLTRRENVNRVMVVREIHERVQIAVLEDDVLVEHYVNRHSGSSLIGNVYLGRIQNVLPSMEAAFVDIGKGRNAVLYAGEVNWDAAGLEGEAKRIEMAFKTGDPVLVQVTKDPIGHKGARLTAQISLPGRFLVYVPDGSMTGISRKLPENERNRLKSILRASLPEEAGVIVRTAAEGASEEDLTRDISRLTAQWEDISEKTKTANAPALLYSEPDLAIKVVRDIFNEDFNQLIVSGDDIWQTLHDYVQYVAPDLEPRLQKWVESQDLYTRYRIEEQLAKAIDRKVWLPSGGSLVIDRTEAMTVVDVNTGKFTGEGGNLEQTVTRNNLEAAEEIVRQLRLRDIGGIVVIDFIDMVLESNRDLVLRRLVECLGRDRTKHQVAEVTSLGLVQMTRKKIGQGLLETFSEPCEHCHSRGVKVRLDMAAAKTAEPEASEEDHHDH